MTDYPRRLCSQCGHPIQVGFLVCDRCGTQQERRPSPPTGRIGFYWTVLLAKGPAHPDEPQVRLWTGYSWLEAGHEPHIAPDACRVVGDELDPPVGLP